jgi:hypothetical protein
VLTVAIYVVGSVRPSVVQVLQPLRRAVCVLGSTFSCQLIRSRISKGDSRASCRAEAAKTTKSFQKAVTLIMQHCYRRQIEHLVEGSSAYL